MPMFIGEPLRALWTRGWRTFPATVVFEAATILFWILGHTPFGTAFTMTVGGVDGSQGVHTSLYRLPFSLFMHAPGLPPWAAMLQVGLLAGIVEYWIGWRHTALVAVLASGAATLSGRLMEWWDNALGYGNPQLDRFELDTGPSVAVVALLVYAALATRTWWVLVATAVFVVGEEYALPNLAGREHIVGVVVGAGLWFVGRAVATRTRARMVAAVPAAADAGSS